MKRNQYQSSNPNSRRELLRLLTWTLACLAVLLVGVGSTVWLRHLTKLSHQEVNRLEAAHDRLRNLETELNRRIASVQSPELMRRELARIGSDLRLPESSQVVRISAAELLAVTGDRPDRNESSLSMSIWQIGDHP